MKLIFSLFTIFMLTDSCKAPKDAVENSDNQVETSAIANKQPMTDKQQAVANRADLVITYQATSRGFVKYISVSEKAVKLSSDRSLKQIDTFDCNKDDWAEIKTLVDAINTNNLRGLKPPSTRHQSDGAAGATLTIIVGDLAHMTPTFDDGNPPAEIEKLVNKVLAIGAKMKKQ